MKYLVSNSQRKGSLELQYPCHQNHCVSGTLASLLLGRKDQEAAAGLESALERKA